MPINLRKERKPLSAVATICVLLFGVVPPIILFIWVLLTPQALYPLPSWVRAQNVQCEICSEPATRSLRNISDSVKRVEWTKGDPIFYCDRHTPGLMTDRGTGMVMTLTWGGMFWVIITYLIVGVIDTFVRSIVHRS
jgi:hypothetical protein